MQKKVALCFSLYLILTLSGCADMPMSRVMARCDIGNNIENFSNYAYCLKATYSREGNAPNAPSVRAFYSYIDVITEKYQQRQITNAEAKSYAYRAWQETIDSNNQKSAARSQAFLNSLNALGTMGTHPSASPTTGYQQGTHTYMINGKMVTCTTTGTITNCF